MTVKVSTTGKVPDPLGVTHPAHYNMHPSGIEVIEICRHMVFDLGCAFKYVARWEQKDGLKDLRKAVWYLYDLEKNPPSLAQMQTNAKPKHLLQEFIKAETNESAHGFYSAVLAYVSGQGPAELVKAKRHVLQLIAKLELQE